MRNTEDESMGEGKKREEFGSKGPLCSVFSDWIISKQ